MGLKRWVAEKLAPDVALRARKYDWLESRVHESYRWLGEFDQIVAWLQWTIEGEQNSWQKLDEESTNRWPWYGAIPDFREQLRRKFPADAKEWRCFHCDEVFSSEHDARLHFGRDEGALPACQIKGSEHGLVEALRRAENDAAEAWGAIHAESTDAARGHFAQNSRHQEQLKAVEQIGYERGLADAKAYPETLGLAAAEPSP
jgi:hypothetical protein